jgi:hypothetical protein
MEIDTNMQIHLDFKQDKVEADILAYTNELAKTFSAFERPWLIGDAGRNQLIVWVNVNALEPVVIPSSTLLDCVRVFRLCSRVTSSEPLISSERK